MFSNNLLIHTSLSIPPSRLALSQFPPVTTPAPLSMTLPLPSDEAALEDKKNMLSGQWRNTSRGPLLLAEHERCRILLYQLNMSPPVAVPQGSSSAGQQPTSAGAKELRREIYRQLFSGISAEAIRTLHIEPPFSCDFGCTSSSAPTCL